MDTIKDSMQISKAAVPWSSVFSRPVNLPLEVLQEIPVTYPAPAAASTISINENPMIKEPECTSGHESDPQSLTAEQHLARGVSTWKLISTAMHVQGVVQQVGVMIL